MRDPLKILEYKASRDPSIQQLVDQVKNEELGEEEIRLLSRPDWLKNALTTLSRTKEQYPLDELTKLLSSAIVEFDDTDKTLYPVFEYYGPDLFVGDSFASNLHYGDLILIKDNHNFVLRNAEKRFGVNDLARVKNRASEIDNMTIAAFKIRYQEDLKKKY
jgi:hypothetical protein